MKLSRLTAFSALVLSGALVACGTPQSAGDSPADPATTQAGEQTGGEQASGEPIRVVVIPPASGALAEFGSEAARAWAFAVDEVNAAGGINGQPVELIRKDTDATPQTTLRMAREAVEQDGAQFIGAVMTSTEHGALNAQLEALGVLSFNGLGKDDALTGADCVANAFRVVQSTTQDVIAVAQAIESIPGNVWDIQAVDYATGHTTAEEFKQAADEHGLSIGAEQYAPLNTTEFGTYISQLQASEGDALLAVEYGADGVAFVNQADQFGLIDKYESILGFNMVSEPLFEALGSKVLGFYNNLGYDVKGDNPLNAAFVEAWTAEHDTTPYFVTADNYLAAQTLFEGIRAAGSSEPAAVREALEGLTFDSIVGEVTMRAEDHQMIRPAYVGQIVEDPDGIGGMGWEVVHEYDGNAPLSGECQL